MSDHWPGCLREDRTSLPDEIRQESGNYSYHRIQLYERIASIPIPRTDTSQVKMYHGGWIPSFSGTSEVVTK